MSWQKVLHENDILDKSPTRLLKKFQWGERYKKISKAPSVPEDTTVNYFKKMENMWHSCKCDKFVQKTDGARWAQQNMKSPKEEYILIYVLVL